jgi:hypothetical protein
MLMLVTGDDDDVDVGVGDEAVVAFLDPPQAARSSEVITMAVATADQRPVGFRSVFI